MKTKSILAILFVILVTMSFECQPDNTTVTDTRDNIVGKWACTLDDGAVPQDYEVEIIKDANVADVIYLANFIANGDTAKATITGQNLTIAQQKVGNSFVSGDGTISDNNQEITWAVKINGDDNTMKFTPGGITKSFPAK